MKKTKKKDKSKAKKAGKKATVLSGAAKSLKKLSKNSVGKLSTTQKVLAGTALGALGVRLLLKKLGKPKAATTTDTDYVNSTAGIEEFGTAFDE
jgi:hypothetical protein